MLNEQETAQAIEQGKGERVTEADLDNAIVSSDYLRVGVLTICVLTLRNGFNVIGESACVDPANYNREIGDSIAYRHARNKIWLLEGYALAERRRTDMPQSDNVVAQQDLQGNASADLSWHDKNMRMECLRTAVGLLASGQVPGGDPLQLSREFYAFANETGDEAK